MGRLDKEAYEGKQRYAERRMAENAEVDALTPDQHEALAWLCGIRHELHTKADVWILEESADYDRFWGYIPDEFSDGPGLIKERMGGVGLSINIPMFRSYNLDDIQNEYVRDDVEAYLRCFDIDTSDMVEAMYCYASRISEEINSAIESYLMNIDAIYGTRYCPSGATRF